MQLQNCFSDCKVVLLTTDFYLFILVWPDSVVIDLHWRVVQWSDLGATGYVCDTCSLVWPTAFLIYVLNKF
jgi:hypothetical protein